MRLLMYYDGQDHSKIALNTVRDRAKVMKAKVHILSSVSGWGESSKKAIHEIRRDLHFVKDVLEEENIVCCTHLRLKSRNPGDDIIFAAIRYQVDEIIIGTDKGSKAARYRHGWFIDRVIEWGKCPVLLV